MHQQARTGLVAHVLRDVHPVGVTHVRDALRLGIFLLTPFLLPGVASGGSTCEAHWAPGPGIPGAAQILALEVFDDGIGPLLHAAGANTLGGLLLRFEEDSWSVVPDAPLGNDIRAMRSFDDREGPALYVAGEFAFAGDRSVGNIARWDGTSWSPLGTGLGGFGLALEVFDDGTGPALYAGGSFGTAGGVVVNRIARWNGTSWSPLGSGISGALVNAMAVLDAGDGPSLYVGGVFTGAGGQPASNIARWDGTNWSAVGPGLPQQVRTLTVFDDGNGPMLYAAGFLTGASGFPFVVRRWNGAAWQQVGTGFNGTINALHVFDDGSGAGPALYAGGDFSAIVTPGGDVPASRIARWNGTTWTPLDNGVDSGVHALASMIQGDQPVLAVGGGFSAADGEASAGVARWVGCPEAMPPSPDLNGDGVVDGGDLGELLANWKLGGSTDLDGNGTTDGADLGILLAAWTT